MEISARELLLTGTLLYGAALAASVLCRHSEPRPARWVPAVLLWLGFLTQFAGLYQRGGETHVFPLGNAFEILQIFAWGVVALDGFLRLTFSLRLPVLLTAGLAALLGGAAFLNPGWDHPASPQFLGNPWVEFHVVMVILSYCFFAAQALNSLVFLLQNHSLERRRFTGIFRFLPPLRQVDQVGVQLLGAGVCLLTLGMIVGLVNFAAAPPSLNTVLKLTCATLVWLGYGTALWLRRKKRLRGARFARVSLGLFLVALLTLWPANAARRNGAARVAALDGGEWVAGAAAPRFIFSRIP